MRSCIQTRETNLCPHFRRAIATFVEGAAAADRLFKRAFRFFFALELLPIVVGLGRAGSARGKPGDTFALLKHGRI